MGDASPIGKDELRGLLEDVSNSAPSGARGTQAQLAAIEALDRLDAPPDSEAEKVRRLFDDRPDDELVAGDDWFPVPPEWGKLYLCGTLGQRRRWDRNLVAEGVIDERE